MTDHAHEFPPPGTLPSAICPGIEVLVHRRATELVVERPRRRLVTASGLGGVAVAAVCAVLVMVLGLPSGSGLMSPRQAVAAVVESLDGDGILHWVREGDLVESPDQVDRPGTLVEEEWTDLATGDSHVVATRTASDGTSRTRTRWRTDDGEWVALSAGSAAGPTIRQEPRLPDQPVVMTEVEALRALLERAEHGAAEIAEAGEDASGRPLVVVTERNDRHVRRAWITREEVPEVVRTETTAVSPHTARQIVTTTTTKTWQILPPTAEARAEVEIPSNAKRVP